MPIVQLPAVAQQRKAGNGHCCRNRPGRCARLELAGNLRDLALFNVAFDSKLHGCNLVKLAVSDLVRDDRVCDRVSVIQSKS